VRWSETHKRPWSWSRPLWLADRTLSTAAGRREARRYDGDGHMPFLGGIVRRPAITRHDRHVTTTACLTCLHPYDTISSVELLSLPVGQLSSLYRQRLSLHAHKERRRPRTDLSPCGRTLAANDNRSSTTPTVTEMRRATTRHNISKPHNINVHVLYDPSTMSSFNYCYNGGELATTTTTMKNRETGIEEWKKTFTRFLCICILSLCRTTASRDTIFFYFNFQSFYEIAVIIVIIIINK